MTLALNFARSIARSSKDLLSASQTINYTEAEQQLIELLTIENLDRQVNSQPELVSNLEAAIANALNKAYIENSPEEDVNAAHFFYSEFFIELIDSTYFGTTI
jgi:hypothetical protein